MELWIGLVVGLLIGWILEWVIDWRFWRRDLEEQHRAATASSTSSAGEPVYSESMLRRELERSRAELAALREQLREAGASVEPRGQTEA